MYHKISTDEDLHQKSMIISFEYISVKSFPYLDLFLSCLIFAVLYLQTSPILNLPRHLKKKILYNYLKFVLKSPSLKLARWQRRWKGEIKRGRIVPCIFYLISFCLSFGSIEFLSENLSRLRQTSRWQIPQTWLPQNTSIKI